MWTQEPRRGETLIPGCKNREFSLENVGRKVSGEMRQIREGGRHKMHGPASHCCAQWELKPLQKPGSDVDTTSVILPKMQRSWGAFSPVLWPECCVIPQFFCWSLNPQCDHTGREGLWEVGGPRWGPEREHVSWMDTARRLLGANRSRSSQDLDLRLRSLQSYEK